MNSKLKITAGSLFAAFGLLLTAQVQAVEECHTETEQRTVQKDNAVPAGAAGAVVGGLVGHAVGGNVATIGGAAGGAALGAHLGKEHVREKTETTQVRKCVDMPPARR